MIYEICKRIQEKEFYYNKSASDVEGLQFLKREPGNNKSEFITLQDIQLFKELAEKKQWTEADFDKKDMSMLELSTWLGTLLPEKCMPVTSRHFRHSIAYIFDLELKIYRESDYEFFAHSQKYFKLTKDKLKEFDVDCLFLREIAEYICYKYPKAMIKKQYDEYDWNWITQDFHLYVYREILGMDSFHKTYRFNQNTKKINKLSEPKVLDIYVP
jgi:hypothetical protein